MKIRVIDLETTGMRGPKGSADAEICEIGFTDVTLDGKISKPFSYLINPGTPIPPEARAIHHISSEMVAGMPSPSEARRMLLEGMNEGDAFAAHNMGFEKEFFDGGGFPWICTMNCSKHLFPEYPAYGNQVLRYFLSLDNQFMWPQLAMPPHRAGPDCYVTAHILRELLRHAALLELVELSTQPVLQKTVRFGQHYGRPWSEMDGGYLQWILGKDFDEEVKATARYWLDQQNRYLKDDPFRQLR